ncbi:MAG: ribonuclease T [Paracoccaceae bacterium]
MLRLTAGLLLALLTISHTVAGTKRSGDFDYYVLALSWSPSWCALQGDARETSQCGDRRHLGFILHGLWPQFEKGWPSYCKTAALAPAPTLTRAMADIMGSGSLARHQWDKHGRCSGLGAESYFALARKAYGRIARPEVFRRLLRPVRLRPTDVKSAFLRENSDLAPEMISATCKRGHFQEVRICLTRTLEPRRCGADVLRDCTVPVVFPPVP